MPTDQEAAYEAAFRQAFDDLGLIVTATDGMSREDLALARLPLSLRAYYGVLGHHAANREHDRLLLPDALVKRDDKVIFLEENQSVSVWAFDHADGSLDDPPVWQGDAEPGGRISWHLDGRTISGFIIARWTWVRTGEEPSR